ncbi:MAG: hypothetical protein CM1200mP10_26750 [Candidatus Neomarinimicrobiota bacterium]|nr:MAG: hypothetical protein CM1200mP10_26750 [Candidatus Neomarinimicrobiota bacterium]
MTRLSMVIELSDYAKSDIIIIGGGAGGPSCAYYLNQAGYEVTIFDGDGPDKKPPVHGEIRG